MRFLRSFMLASFLSVHVMVCCAAEPSQSLQLSPIAFETNRGQAPEKYSFLFRRDGLRAMFSANGADLALCSKSGCDEKLALSFLGAHSVPESTSAMTGHANYFLGNDSARWIGNIPLSSVIEYKDLYPGISLSFYGNGEELEHDFRIAPGADPSRIALRFDGATRIDQASDGSLEIHTANGELTLKRPIAYQQTGTDRIPVDARFLEAGDGSIGFRVGAYDHKRPLVIDPVIVFSSYLGGTGTDLATAITTDATGNVLVTGSTTSTDFPTSNPLQSSLGTNGQSVFVTKFDPTGKTLIYSTYLGGSSQALGAASATGGAIAVDANGNAILAGLTSSGNFPVAGAGTSLSCQTNDQCFFLASLSPDGSTLNYSGTVGGEQGFYILGTGVNLAVDATGNAYLAGTTDNSNFQITAGTLATSVAGYPYNETFVLKVDPTGKLLYSTVIPGTDTNSTDLLQPYTNDFIPTGIAVDTLGDVTIAGTTGLGLPTTSGVVSPQFPNAYVNVENPSAGFLLQLNPTASAINFATYLPGTDYGFGLAVDTAGNFYVTGGTQETNLPVSSNAYQKAPVTNSFGQTEGAYVIVLNPQATAVAGATYLGAGAAGGYGFRAIALDSHNNIYLGGYAESQGFPLQDPFVTEYEYTGSTADMVLAEVSPDLSTLEFGSFFSATTGVFAGSGFAGLAIDQSNNLIVAGTTDSSSFPTTSDSFEPQLPPPVNPLSVPQHSFVAKFNMSTPAPAVCFNSFSVSFGNVNANSSGNQTVNVTNCGNAPLTISSVSSSDPTVVASQTCGQVAAGSSCATTLTFTPVSSLATSGTVTFNTNAATLPQSVSFTGQGIASQIVASPNPLAFGHYLVGSAAVNETLEISNAGQATLAIGNIGVTGAGYSLVSNNCTQPLQAYSICFLTLGFTPTGAGLQSGSVSISSNDPVNPNLTVALTGTGETVYGVPTITANNAPTVLINSGNVNLTLTGTNFYPQSVVQLNGLAQSTTFVSNTTLNATIAASSLTALGELPLTVVNPVPGGGTSPSITITPYQTVLINPSALASVPATGMIYAAIPSSAPQNPNTVIPVDPTSGTPGTPIPVMTNPQFLSASDDGSYLYVAAGYNGTSAYTLDRINLQSGAVDRTFSFAPNPDCSTCSLLAASDLKSVPGSPQEVVLAQGSTVALYNDSGLVNYVPNSFVEYFAPQFTSIAFAGDPLAIYAEPFTTVQNPFFTTAAITSSGLQYTEFMGTNYGPPSGTGNQVISDGTLLYTNSGEIWNPNTQALVGSFPINTTEFPTITLDTTTGKLFSAGSTSYSYSMEILLAAYGLTSQKLTGVVEFPQIYWPNTSSLVRWGADGLAFIQAGVGQTDQELYLLRTSIVTPQSVNPTPVLQSIAPASVVAGSATFTLTVSGSDFVSDSIVEWNGSALTTTFVSAQKLTASVPASDIASAGSAQIAVFNPAPGGGSSAVSDLTIVVPVETTTSLAITPTGTLTTGASYSLAATVSATSGTGSPSGNVVFNIGSASQTVALNSAGTATYAGTAPSVPGSLSISAAYQGSQGFLASTSSTLNINVAASANPVPNISFLSPAFTSSGGSSFTLTVSGSGFVSGSIVYWGTAGLATQFVSASQLTAQVTASQIASAGITAITVETPAPGSGTSNTMQFEVDSGASGLGPTFGSSSASIAPGGSESYPVTLPASATNASVTCLNLPSGVTCSYSPTSGTLTINTSSSTPAGTYVITAVFTETLPGAAGALFLLPILLMPRTKGKRKSRYSRAYLLACAGILLLVVLAGNGCGGGGGGGSTTPPTHQVTSSGTITLTVQ